MELEQFMIQWLKKHSLTYGEIFTIYGEQISRTAKYAVRTERQSDDSDKE